MTDNLPQAGPPVPEHVADALRALYPWTGDADRLVDNRTGWDVIEVPGMHPHAIEADIGTAVIRVGDREHLRRMLKAEHERALTDRDEAARKRQFDRARRDAELGTRRAIAATIPPYRDPDAIPAPGDR